MNKISVVISYCSLENRFIDKIIDECKIFSDDIVVVRAESFLDGTPDTNAKDFNDDVTHTVIIDPSEGDIKKLGSRHFHNVFRYTGWKNLSGKNKYVLFLDADEVPNGDMVRDFLDEFDYEQFNGISFDAYWYFRETTNRARAREETTALFRVDTLTEPVFFGPSERWTMFTMGKCLRRLQPPMHDGPMFHHYSWVRTEEEMLKKVSSWGHQGDMDWAKLVKLEFSHDFNGRDFVHGYQYDKVESFI